MTTVADVIDQVRGALSGTAITYTDELLTVCVREALRELNGVTGYERMATLTTTGGYELDVSALVQPAKIKRVWFPYTDGDHELAVIGFDQLLPTLIRARDVYLSEGYTARLLYRTPHTLELLDGAAATTLTETEIGDVVTGACAGAAWAKAQAYAATVNANRYVTKTLQALYERKRREFETRLLIYRVQARQVKVRNIGGKRSAPTSWLAP